MTAPAPVDLNLGLELCHAGIRQVRRPEHPRLLDQIEVVVSVRHHLRDLLTTLARATVDEPQVTHELFDEFMICDAQLQHVDNQAASWDPVGAGMSWETAYDRAAADASYAEQRLAEHLTTYAGHPLDTVTVELSTTAAKQFGGRILTAVWDAEQ